MRRRTLLAGLPLLLSTAEAFAHPPRQPDPAEAKRFIQEITDFRARLAKAVLAKDFAAMRPLYADSFTHTHGSGKLDNKDARLVDAMAGEPLIEAAPRHRPQLPCLYRPDRDRHRQEPDPERQGTEDLRLPLGVRVRDRAVRLAVGCESGNAFQLSTIAILLPSPARMPSLWF